MMVFWVHLEIDQPPTWASGVDRPSYTKSHPVVCWVTLLLSAKHAVVLGQPSSLRPHWVGPHPDHAPGCISLYSIKPESRNPGRILTSFHTKSQATGAVALRPVTGQQTYYGRQVISKTLAVVPQRKIWAQFCLWKADSLPEQKRPGGQFHYIAPLTL